jgi:hypothetical protein
MNVGRDLIRAETNEEPERAEAGGMKRVVPSM